MRFLEKRAIETWHFDIRSLAAADTEKLTRDLAAFGAPISRISTLENSLSVWIEDPKATEEELLKLFKQHELEVKLREKTRETEKEVFKRLGWQFVIQVFFSAFFLYVLRVLLAAAFHGLAKAFPGITEGSGNAWFWSIQAFVIMLNFRYRSDPIYIIEWLLGFALSFIAGAKHL